MWLRALNYATELICGRVRVSAYDRIEQLRILFVVVRFGIDSLAVRQRSIPRPNRSPDALPCQILH